MNVSPCVDRQSLAAIRSADAYTNVEMWQALQAGDPPRYASEKDDIDCCNSKIIYVNLINKSLTGEFGLPAAWECDIVF